MGPEGFEPPPGEVKARCAAVTPRPRLRTWLRLSVCGCAMRCSCAQSLGVESNHRFRRIRTMCFRYTTKRNRDGRRRNRRLTRVGFEPNLAGLKDRQPHEKSNGPCVRTLSVSSHALVWKVGWKALESFSPGLQPGAKPSQLPAHWVLIVRLRRNEKARRPLRDTGLWKARGGVWPMSRAQGIRGVLAAPFQTSRRSESIIPDLETYEVRGDTDRIASFGTEMEPSERHDFRDR